MAAYHQAEENDAACPICLEFLSDTTLCTLPCEHEFHQECVEALRKLGVVQACPLCRADLPNGPEKLFEDAARTYVLLDQKILSGKTSWQTLAASEQKIATEAKEMFTTAAKQGLARAQHSLGHILDQGKGVVQDHVEGARWIRKAVDQGDVSAHNVLGGIYLTGRGVTQDAKEGARWILKAAEQGNVTAQCQLGIMYETGEGVPKDQKKVVHWNQKAADQGDAGSQNNLALLYKNVKE
jgi:TPR repeat protein